MSVKQIIIYLIRIITKYKETYNLISTEQYSLINASLREWGLYGNETAIFITAVSSFKEIIKFSKSKFNTLKEF